MMTCSILHHLWLLILCHILLLPTAVPQTYSNISLGSYLTASDDSSSWSSPSGDFAFGFHSIGTKGFLLSIWFNKIPAKTVVWSANQGDLVQKGSTVELTQDGKLVLRDHQGREPWKVETVSGTAAYASMMDTGNFVLQSADSVTLWQSFDVPTDTLLPTQTLNLGNVLVSRMTDTNYSSGRFQLRLETDGNLVLYVITLINDVFYQSYWSSMTDRGTQLVYNQSGYIYLTQSNGSLLHFTPANVASTNNFYHRATLDYDGVMRQYVHPKTIGKSWTTLWSVPSNICLTIKSKYGSGACGYNSYCREDENQRPTCECPPRYSYMDPSNKFGGCKPDFLPPTCDAGSREASLFDMRGMADIDWFGNEYEAFRSVDENWCREACLSDCLCAIAISIDDVCWKKGYPFLNGRKEVGFKSIALIKVRRENTSHSIDSGQKKEHTRMKINTTQLLLGGSIFINSILMLTITLFTLWTYYRRSQRVLPHMPDINLQSYTYKELNLATNSFKEELGRGASATVYKAFLSSGNRIVAVKKLEERMTEGDKEFLTEVSAIGRTNHKNLVQLLGFCNEGKARLLVYEFMSNGSLASLLFGESKPKWNERIRFARGIARGLTYLHEGCSNPIIHCDIKPQNILIGDSFEAKISDFGLAKLMKPDQTRTSTGIRGTRGYVAPEWFSNMDVTVDVDVYSFGVMLLEIICCRKHVESRMEDERKMILTDWTYDCYANGRLDLLVENDEEAVHDIAKLESLVMIALWCIQEDPTERPAMSKVTQMLDGTVEVCPPPYPYCKSI